MIKQLRSALDKKQIGAVELTKEYLKKIEKTSDKNCFITITAEQALLDAEKAQKKINENSAEPLTGIPIAVKDNICTKDVRTTCASRMLLDFVPSYDATAVEKLKKQGCVLLGKTNMDEFAMGNTSENSFFGAVKNPIYDGLVAGGSSGGSAAAVKLGLCPVALGSDTGGSVRQPAAFCGTYGLKPTYGRVSRFGLISFAPSLDQIGIFAESSEDISIVLNAISGKDDKDFTSRSSEACVLKDVSGKIGLPKEFFDYSDPKVASAVEAAALHFEKFGFDIEYCSIPDLRYALPAYYIISSAEAASNLSRFDGIKYGFSQKGKDYEEIINGSRTFGFSDEVKRRLLLGNYCLSAGYYDKYYIKAQSVRQLLKTVYSKLLSKYDFLITPTAPTLPYPANTHRSPSDAYMADILTVTANLTGLPCINVPCTSLHSDLIGMSITGREFSESELLSLSYIYERSL